MSAEIERAIIARWLYLRRRRLFLLLRDRLEAIAYAPEPNEYQIRRMTDDLIRRYGRALDALADA